MTPRRMLFPAGITLMLIAPPLQLVSFAVFAGLWYAGSALVLAWLLTTATRRLEYA